MHERATDVLDWLQPLKSVSNFTHTNLPELISQLKQYADDISELPKGLITVLRIIQHLAIAPNVGEGECFIFKSTHQWILRIFFFVFALSTILFTCFSIFVIAGFSISVVAFRGR